ncbi:MAG: DEAD/DEAH box helicase [bacterium]
MENKFKTLGLSENVLYAIEKLNYQTPSQIQEQLIPFVLQGHDCFGQAQTGTGKTLAFASAILSNLNMEKTGIKAIVLTPTRELALQISKEFTVLDYNNEFKTVAVFGGDSLERQIKQLRGPVDVVVGTPGRVKDLIKRRKLNLTAIDYFVLDEADEMLNMGFLEEIEEIFSKTARDKQVIMMSATLSREIKELTKNYMKPDAKHIIIESLTRTSDNIDQCYYLVNEKQRDEALFRILDDRDVKKGIIFTKTKNECDNLTIELQNKGFEADAIHGDIAQRQRIAVLDKFKKDKFTFLIATDVAARGIHVNNVELIVNYKLPQDNESYIHRIGRTGRANNKGEAISLINNKEIRVIHGIAKHAKCEIKEKVLPDSKDIIKMKYEKIINTANEMVKNADLSESTEYVRDLNKADLLQFTAALLKYSAEKEIRHNTTQDLSVQARKVNETATGQTRIFLNIGKMDGLKMGSLLDLIKDTTDIDKDHFNNIEVLQTFTFIDVTDEHVNDFIDKFTGTDIKGRSVRIEISNNKSKSGSGRGRSNSRGRSYGSNSRGGSRDNNRDNNRGNRRDSYKGKRN